MIRSFLLSVLLFVAIVVGVIIIVESTQYITSDNYEWNLERAIFGSANEKETTND